MKDLSIAVSLKAPDPSAITALSTMKRLAPRICPDRLQRYDHWLFLQPGQGRRTVEEIVSHYHDIVNPNKQLWHFTDDPAFHNLHDDGLRYTEVLVTDIVNSISDNWTDILRRRDFHVAGVVYSVLWRFGFPEDMKLDDTILVTRELTLTTSRNQGLLANPVSQKIQLLDPV